MLINLANGFFSPSAFAYAHFRMFQRLFAFSMVIFCKLFSFFFFIPLIDYNAEVELFAQVGKNNGSSLIQCLLFEWGRPFWLPSYIFRGNVLIGGLWWWKMRAHISRRALFEMKKKSALQTLYFTNICLCLFVWPYVDFNFICTIFKHDQTSTSKARMRTARKPK